jgi:hypothetical protein
MNSLKYICLLSFTATAIALMPTATLAQTTNKTVSKQAASKPAIETKVATESKETVKKPVAGPFHGKLAALDKNLKTITVGKRTFHISSETQIKKAGKLATLDDGVVGEEASGYVKPDENGNLIATKVNFGPKAPAASGK